MKKITRILLSGLLVAASFMPALYPQTAQALNLTNEDFARDVINGSWLSGGAPNTACLTASRSTTGDIRGCDSESAIDEEWDGALRLTSNAGNQAGYVINQTPVSTNKGLEISFDMYQYDGSGADGVAFFLIDGSKSPTQPGAFGGSLGYSNNDDTPGLVGGYVGVGFDVFGNFSSPQAGTNGPGSQANSITVRGSQATGYKFVTTTPASDNLANNDATDRNEAVRHVTVSISPDNIMSIYVDYGSGSVKELDNINLNTVNGINSLPNSLKFGFSASTGGSDNIHEINNLSVDTLPPNVRATATQTGVWQQGGMGQFTIVAKNDPVAADASGIITVKDTLPATLNVTAVSGEGWTCEITNLHLPTCTRTIASGDPLQPGQSLPPITVTVAVAQNATASLSHNTVVLVPGNSDAGGPSNYGYFAVIADDLDGADYTTENAAPHGGDANGDSIKDATQANVTSFVSAVTGNYVTLATSGCNKNIKPLVNDVSHNSKPDANYVYPIGMMDFSITCTTPGSTAAISQYYFGDYDADQYVARKYSATTQTYIDIPGAVISNITIGGESALKVTYSIKDGGALDDDGLENGTIVDPAGPAIKYSAPVNSVVGSGTIGAPNTGIGIGYANPIATLLGYGAVAIVLLGSALAVRRQTKHL